MRGEEKISEGWTILMMTTKKRFEIIYFFSSLVPFNKLRFTCLHNFCFISAPCCMHLNLITSLSNHSHKRGLKLCPFSLSSFPHWCSDVWMFMSLLVFHNWNYLQTVNLYYSVRNSISPNSFGFWVLKVLTFISIVPCSRFRKMERAMFCQADLPDFSDYYSVRVFIVMLLIKLE